MLTTEELVAGYGLTFGRYKSSRLKDESGRAKEKGRWTTEISDTEST
jgi:hypothetical protein